MNLRPSEKHADLTAWLQATPPVKGHADPQNRELQGVQQWMFGPKIFPEEGPLKKWDV